MMKNSFTEYNPPLEVDIAEWLFYHMGRFSIGKSINNKKALIYAFSDASEDIRELRNIAKQKKYETFRSASMRGITDVEKC